MDTRAGRVSDQGSPRSLLTLREALAIVFLVALEHFVLDEAHDVGEGERFLARPACKDVLRGAVRFSRFGI